MRYVLMTSMVIAAPVIKAYPNEYKIMVIDNAAFHSIKNIVVPDNIYLLRIPPYTPELNPCEQIWQHIKYCFRNKHFDDMID